MDIVTSAKLARVRNEIRQKFANVDSALANFPEEERGLMFGVTAYNNSRARLFQEKIERRGMTWCTECKKLFRPRDTTFILVEGLEPDSDNEGVLEACRRICRVCWGCRNDVFLRRALENKHLYCCDAEEVEGGFVVNKGGLPIFYVRQYHLDSPPYDLVDRMSKELGLPPSLEVVQRGDRLVLVEDFPN